MGYVGVDMPGVAFGGLFGMFAEIVQRISGRAGVNPFCRVQRGLFCCLFLHAHPPIENG